MTQDDRLAYDRDLYGRAIAMVGAGEWREPWPG